MAEDRDKQTLSTADMAAAAARQPNATPTTAAVADTRSDPQAKTPMPGDGASVSQAAGMPGGDDKHERLLEDGFTSNLRRRWTDVQAGFVDEPRQAVKQADSLVAEVIKQLAETFAQERTHLEQQWDRGGDVSTEDLRVALRRYRTFFERLLST